MTVALGRAPSLRAAAEAGREHEQDGEGRRHQGSVELRDEYDLPMARGTRASDELRSRSDRSGSTNELLSPLNT